MFQGMKRNLLQVYFFPQVQLRTRYLSATCRSQLRLPHRVLHRFRQTVWHSRPGWSIVVWPLIGRCFTARSIDDIGDHECPATSRQHRIRNLMFCESWSVLLYGNDESFKAFKEPCPNCHSAQRCREVSWPFPLRYSHHIPATCVAMAVKKLKISEELRSISRLLLDEVSQGQIIMASTR